MYTLEFFYIGTTAASVFTALPQLKQLWKMKNSDEFNLLSWTAWLLAQIIALFYALSIHSGPYLAVNIMWILFYLAMIGLIIKYRRGSMPELAQEKATENDQT